MALRIIPRPKFRAQVTARVPLETGGTEEQTFSVLYRLASDSRAALGTAEEQDAFLRDIIERIDDLVDESGQPLPWDDNVREAVLVLPWAQIAILRGYFEGVTAARLGN